MTMLCPPHTRLPWGLCTCTCAGLFLHVRCVFCTVLLTVPPFPFLWLCQLANPHLPTRTLCRFIDSNGKGINFLIKETAHKSGDRCSSRHNTLFEDRKILKKDQKIRSTFCFSSSLFSFFSPLLCFLFLIKKQTLQFQQSPIAFRDSRKRKPSSHTERNDRAGPSCQVMH